MPPSVVAQRYCDLLRRGPARVRRRRALRTTLAPLHTLTTAILHFLLIGFVLLFLIVIQNCFDLLRVGFMHALHLRHFVVTRRGRVAMHGLHLLLLILEDGLDLALLIGGEFVALGHVSKALIGIHAVAAVMTAHSTAFGLRSILLGCGPCLLRKHHAGCQQPSKYETTQLPFHCLCFLHARINPSYLCRLRSASHSYVRWSLGGRPLA